MPFDCVTLESPAPRIGGKPAIRETRSEADGSPDLALHPTTIAGRKSARAISSLDSGERQGRRRQANIAAISLSLTLDNYTQY